MERLIFCHHGNNEETCPFCNQYEPPFGEEQARIDAYESAYDALSAMEPPGSDDWDDSARYDEDDEWEDDEPDIDDEPPPDYGPHPGAVIREWD